MWPHAVMSVSGSTVNTTFTYDPNGNQTAGLGRTITWTSYNMPASITQGTQTISFLHDPNHQRVKLVLRMLVTGGPLVRGGGGMPQRIMVISRPSSWSVLRMTEAGKSGNTPVIGARLPT